METVRERERERKQTQGRWREIKKREGQRGCLSITLMLIDTEKTYREERLTEHISSLESGLLWQKQTWTDIPMRQCSLTVTLEHTHKHTQQACTVG